MNQSRIRTSESRTNMFPRFDNITPSSNLRIVSLFRLPLLAGASLEHERVLSFTCLGSVLRPNNLLLVGCTSSFHPVLGCLLRVLCLPQSSRLQFLVRSPKAQPDEIIYYYTKNIVSLIQSGRFPGILGLCHSGLLQRTLLRQDISTPHMLKNSHPPIETPTRLSRQNTLYDDPARPTMRPKTYADLYPEHGRLHLRIYRAISVNTSSPNDISSSTFQDPWTCPFLIDELAASTLNSTADLSDASMKTADSGFDIRRTSVVTAEQVTLRQRRNRRCSTVPTLCASTQGKGERLLRGEITLRDTFVKYIKRAG